MSLAIHGPRPRQNQQRATCSHRVRVASAMVASLWLLNACSSSSSSTRLAYVATGTGIFAYRVNRSSGSTVPIIGSPFLATTSTTTATSPASLAVHPSNHFLYVANQDQNTISLFKIDLVSGALTEVLPRTPTGISPGPLLLNTSGNTLFVADQRSNDVSSFSVSASGALSLVSRVFLASAPSGLASPASGNLLFVALPNLSAVDVFSVNSGSLSLVAGGPFLVSGGVASVAVDSQGKFLFAPNPSRNTVSGFVIQPGGSLTGIPRSPFAAGTAPVAALVDPSGGFLYVSNSGDTTLSQYSIASSGSLTALTATSPTVGTNPGFLTLDPGGKLVFVANVGSQSFTELSINSDGSLGTPSNSIQVGSVPRGLSFTQ